MTNPFTSNQFYIQRNKIINEHLDKYPDAGSNTIARIIYRDYPEFFMGVEKVRSLIRYKRGANGKLSREQLTDRRYVKIPAT
jgi:hypothetical protein